MKHAALPMLVACAVAGVVARAQGADDPMAQLRACSLMERADRLECLDRLSHAAVPSVRPPGAEDWIVSQTTSPVDYAPIATATTTSREAAGGTAMELFIRCRSGRTELAIAGPAISGRPEDYVVSYRVNGGQPAQVAATAPAFGAGIALKGDVAALLQSLPGEGELAVRLSPRLGTGRDAVFSLVGLDVVRTKIEATCRWPHAVAKPNN